MKLFIGLCCAFLVLAGCRVEGAWHETFVFGTVCRLKLYEKAPPALHTEVFARLAGLENILSANKSGTDLDLVNQNAGIAPVKVSRELIDALSRAVFFARLSEAETLPAAFDPTVGPLVKLWNIGFSNEHLPDADAIQTALSYINWRDIEINAEDSTVFLTKKNMGLDLGAIAKGYAADEAVVLIKAAGVTNALLDFGGNIYALGKKNDGSAFKIGIQDPGSSRGSYLGILEVSDKTLVTSGVYERFFEHEGIRYHHILSTKTGFPVVNDLLSVTIVSKNSMDADALSTLVFALGYEQGSALLASMPDAAAIFVFNDGRIITSDVLKDSFHQ